MRFLFRDISFSVWPLGLGVVLLFGGCKGDYRPLATGDDAEITVIVDSAQWVGTVGDAIREVLGKPIATLPVPEAAFELRAADIEDGFDALRERKNILIVAVLQDSSSEAQFIQARLPGGDEQGLATASGIFAMRPDLWRRGQLVVYVAAHTPDALAQLLRDRGEELRGRYDAIIRRRLAAEMFDKARQISVEDTLMNRHGFAVNVQHDYYVATDTTGFVWLRRVMPDTWRSFFVHYENGSPPELTAEWLRATRDSLTKAYLRGNLDGYMAIDERRPLEASTITFLGRKAIEIRGLWQMVSVRADGTTYPAGMGGPFLSYGFYDEISDRTYLLDGTVFAPDFEKREFLRQMEAIAYTFRTSEDVERRAASEEAVAVQ